MRSASRRSGDAPDRRLHRQRLTARDGGGRGAKVDPRQLGRGQVRRRIGRRRRRGVAGAHGNKENDAHEGGVEQRPGSHG